MKSIRLITINDDKEVHFTGAKIDEFVTGREAAIQRFLLAFLTTPGTQVENANYGGGARKLIFLKRSEPLQEVRLEVADRVQRTEETLRKTEPPGTPHTITGVSLRDLTRQTQRGLNIDLDLDFFDATATNLTLPVNTHATP